MPERLSDEPRVGWVDFNRAIDEWLDYQKSHCRCSEGILAVHGLVLKRFAEKCGEGQYIEFVGELSPRDIVEYRSSIERGENHDRDLWPLSDMDAHIRVILADSHMRILKRFLMYCWTCEYVGDRFRTMPWPPGAPE